MCPSSVSSPHTGLFVLAVVLGMQVQGEEHGDALDSEDQQQPDKEPRKRRKQGHLRHVNAAVAALGATAPLPRTANPCILPSDVPHSSGGSGEEKNTR